jgi:cell wall assembly regulator SMI1
LNPPATDAEIRNVEAGLGSIVPSDLRVLWRKWNGENPRHNPPPGALIPPSFHPAPIESAMETREMWLDLSRELMSPNFDDFDAFLRQERQKPAGTPCAAWLPEWMPIATDHGGSHLFADLRKGSNSGYIMQFGDQVDALDSMPLWPSVTDMLEEIASRLEMDTSNPAHGRYIDSGKLFWI